MLRTLPGLARAALLAATLLMSTNAAAFSCDRLWRWFAYQCDGLADAYENGGADLYLTGWTHHNRHTYTREKIEGFNEESWGGGFGTSKRNDRGDSFGWYALAFRDSHYDWTKVVGWTWITYWPAQSKYGVGLGYTAFLGSRPDIYSNVPFPGILPLASVRLGAAEIMGTYIPKVSGNTTGNGNVGFVFMRIHF
ncbi:MAG: phospholipid:lipid A palmitoyltransferase [Casimicrobiaceae bacterium]